MGLIGDKLSNTSIKNAVKNSYSTKRYVAIVLGADEKNNTCKVSYIDDQDKKRVIPTLPVAIFNSGWFPNEGDAVFIDIDPNHRGHIESLATSDFMRDVKSNKAKAKDNSVDSTGITCGSIY